MKLSEMFDWCVNATYQVSGLDVDHLLAPDGNTLYVLFKGSDSESDWKQNFKFCDEPFCDGKIIGHRGFIEAWRSIIDELHDNVQNILDTNENINSIVCIGYSHGAALCCLVTMQLSKQFGERCDVKGYGFGCPRVIKGSVPKAFKEDFAKFTIVNNRMDIVPHLPPLLFGFRHTSKPIHVGKWFDHNPIDAHRYVNFLPAIQEYEGTTLPKHN